MYKKILVPVDGSTTSDRGFDEALKLAKVLGASLLVLHVVDTYPMVTGMEMATADTWQQVSDGLRSHGQNILAQAHAAAIAQQVAVENRMAEGNQGRVADVIVELAKSSHCDLIVMGTHGRRGLSKLALGSDADRVTRLSTLPVLLVRHAAADD
jgi:nucleotide-binding universal stress UspA family protein